MMILAFIYTVIIHIIRVDEMESKGETQNIKHISKHMRFQFYKIGFHQKMLFFTQMSIYSLYLISIQSTVCNLYNILCICSVQCT